MNREDHRANKESGEMSGETIDCGEYTITEDDGEYTITDDDQEYTITKDNGEYFVTAKTPMDKYKVRIEIYYEVSKEFIINAPTAGMAGYAATNIPKLTPVNLNWNNLHIGVKEVKPCSR